jgi:hypothetical protein
MAASEASASDALASSRSAISRFGSKMPWVLGERASAFGLLNDRFDVDEDIVKVAASSIGVVISEGDRE